MSSQGPGGATLSWHLVHTKPRQEAVALENLQRQGYTCYLPRLKVEKLRRRQLQVVSEPLFPRYLFIQLDASAGGKSWAPIRSTLGVSTLVRFGEQVARVDDEVIKQLRLGEQLQEEMHAEGGGIKRLFQPGEALVITDGPFKGLEAVFEIADSQRRVFVLLEIMSRAVRVPVGVDQVRSKRFQVDS